MLFLSRDIWGLNPQENLSLNKFPHEKLYDHFLDENEIKWLGFAK